MERLTLRGTVMARASPFCGTHQYPVTTSLAFDGSMRRRLPSTEPLIAESFAKEALNSSPCSSSYAGVPNLNSFSLQDSEDQED
jgi:hypothetical protein